MALRLCSRRQFLATLGIVISVPIFIKCKPDIQTPLTIASQVWPGYELMYLALKEGWLPEQDLTLVETNSATSSLIALSEGKIDGAALTLDEVLHARAQGTPLTVVMVFDVSAGADMLLVKPGIETLPELAGKRIGVEQSAVGALMLHKVLQAAQLSTSDITVVPVRIDQHLSAWLDNEIDAIISYDPTANLLLAKNAHRLFDSRDIPDTIFDVLAIRPEAMQKHAKVLRELIAGHFKARSHFLHNPQDASYRLATRLGLTGPEVLVSYKGLILPDIKNNRRFLAEPGGNLLEAAKNLSALMVNAGLLSQPDTLADLVNAEFLPEDL